MKTIRSTIIAAVLALPLAASAAEGLGGAKVQPGAADAPARGEPRRPQCEGSPEQCREQMRARFEERCRENPQQCAEMKAKIEQRRAECQADPGKCREQARARFDERLRQADSDGNGALSRTEAEQGMPAISRHFDAIDTNGDGQITREELEAAQAKRGAPRSGGRGTGSPSSGPGALPGPPSQRGYDA